MIELFPRIVNYFRKNARSEIFDRVLNTFLNFLPHYKEEVSIKSDAKKMKDRQISKIIIALYYCKLSANSLAMIPQFL